MKMISVCRLTDTTANAIELYGGLSEVYILVLYKKPKYVALFTSIIAKNN